MKEISTELYQDLALQFFKPGHRHHDYLLQGLQEEADEVVNATTEKEMLAELGDVLWYVTILANRISATLNDVMIANINKLEKRQLNGKGK